MWKLLKTETDMEIDAETLSAHIGLLKTTKKYDLKRIISFHSKIERAKYFASDHQNIYGWVTDKERPEGVLFSDYVSGKMSTGDRNKKIKRLKFNSSIF